MAKLTNMKMDPPALTASAAPEPYPEGPAYPWGLSITLNDQCLEKLKIETLPEAGETFILLAKVKVTATEARDVADGKKYRSVSLQITDMALEDKGDKKAAESVLYEG